jgi:hypothetical protein
VALFVTTTRCDDVDENSTCQTMTRFCGVEAYVSTTVGFAPSTEMLAWPRLVFFGITKASRRAPLSVNVMVAPDWVV